MFAVNEEQNHFSYNAKKRKNGTNFSTKLYGSGFNRVMDPMWAHYEFCCCRSPAIRRSLIKSLTTGYCWLPLTLIVRLATFRALDGLCKDDFQLSFQITSRLNAAAILIAHPQSENN